MLVSTIGSASATYDAAGRMTGDGTYTYSWDAEGRLISVSGANVTSTFTYNGLSQMVEANEPGTDEEMIYDAFGRLTGHYDLITSVWSSVLFPRGSNSFAFYNGPPTGSTTLFSHYTPLGSATTVGANGSALPPQESVYYPWGQVWADYEFSPLNEGDFAGMKSAGSDYWSVCDRLPWATTACRGYNTSEGRWMSPDADGGDVSNPQSLNRYSYALNNPTNLIDPEGLSASAPGWTYASQPGAGGSDPDKCKAPPSPCNTAGNAPDPSVYAAKGQAASTNAIKDFYDLFQFRAGGGLDAQPQGASPAYANYVYGVYMAAAGYTLNQALAGADIYAQYRSRYPANVPMDGPNHAFTPVVNVMNITYGFNAQKTGTLCHKY